MKKIISKVLIFTVLWTSLFSGSAQMAFAAPSTKTVIENDYTVDYEQGDYDIVESDLNAAILSNKNGLSAISSSQNVDVYKDGQWTKETEQTVTWSPDSTVVPSKSYVSDSIGLGWSDVNKVQITFSEASNVPQTSSGSQGAFTPTMQPLASTAMKASTVSSGYGDSVNFNSPTMQAASVQANSSAAPSGEVEWIHTGEMYHGEEVPGGKKGEIWEKLTRTVLVTVDSYEIKSVIANNTTPYDANGKTVITVNDLGLKQVKYYVDETVPDTSKTPIGYEQKSELVTAGYTRTEYKEIKTYVPTTYKTIKEWVPPVVEITKIWKPAVYKSVTKVIQPAIYGTRTRTVAATYKTVIVTAGYYKWVLDSKTGEPKQVWVAAVTKQVVDKPAYSYTETYLISPEETKVVQELVTPGKWVEEQTIVQNGYYKDVRVVDREAHYVTDYESYEVYIHPVYKQVNDLTKPIYPTKVEKVEKTRYEQMYDIVYQEKTQKQETRTEVMYEKVSVNPNTDPVNNEFVVPVANIIKKPNEAQPEPGQPVVIVTENGDVLQAQIVYKGENPVVVPSNPDETFNSENVKVYTSDAFRDLSDAYDKLFANNIPTTVETIQFVLDIVGFIPAAIGNTADVLNVLLSLSLAAQAPTLAEVALHFMNAALNSIGLIPLLGNAMKDVFKYVSAYADVLSGGMLSTIVTLMLKNGTSVLHLSKDIVGKIMSFIVGALDKLETIIYQLEKMGFPKLVTALENIVSNFSTGMTIIKEGIEDAFEKIAQKTMSQLPAKEVADIMVKEALKNGYTAEAASNVLKMIANKEITEETAVLILKQLRDSESTVEEIIDLIKQVEALVEGTSKLVTKHLDDAKAVGISNSDALTKMSNNFDEAIANGKKFTDPELPTGGAPKGKYEVPDVNDPGPITRQNSSADLLANKGYDVEMLPETVGGNGYGIKPDSNPDFLINGNAFDCYSPETANVRNIWSTVEAKTSSQASRIILNVDAFKGSMDDLANQFLDWPIDNLEELLVIKNGTISRLIIK